MNASKRGGRCAAQNKCTDQRRHGLSLPLLPPEKHNVGYRITTRRAEISVRQSTKRVLSAGIFYKRAAFLGPNLCNALHLSPAALWLRRFAFVEGFPMFKRFAGLAIVATITIGPCAARADVVTDWNQTAIEVMKTANVSGNPWSRVLAMMHVAMSDAVNSVGGKYQRYVTSLPSKPSASAEAAAASAARQVLLQLFPNQKAAIDAAYATSVGSVAEGLAKSDGIALASTFACTRLKEIASSSTCVSRFNSASTGTRYVVPLSSRP